MERMDWETRSKNMLLGGMRSTTMPAHVRFAGNPQLINFSKTRVIGQENGRRGRQLRCKKKASGLRSAKLIRFIITRATSRSIPTGPNRG